MKGPTCHLGQYSCFGEEEFNISKLEKIIESRLDNPSEESYTSSLFNKGIKEIAKKLLRKLVRFQSLQFQMMEE